ncbi:hypothetical protein [Arthrobacter rhombi]|uniref:hypothetical protein n=1 Tax=Arthrobacter rhombi TaxID=71253 RepID=UPI003FD3EE7F
MISKNEGVFADNRKLPIHRWYPFIEGYSSHLVARALAQNLNAESIFDPFSGSGTTALTCAISGRNSGYAEVNPYLRWVASVKTDASRAAVGEHQELDLLVRFLGCGEGRKWGAADPDDAFAEISKRRDYFQDDAIASIVGSLRLIDEQFSGSVRELGRLAVAASLTPASNMMRRTDLRRRTAKDSSPANFALELAKNVRMIVEDVKTSASSITATATLLGENALHDYAAHSPFDLIVTSPPYLNGTNYCRNTKLELLALGFMSSESELEGLRPAMITAGINNVSKANRQAIEIDWVESTILDLAGKAYDARIPKMITRYFSDMHQVLENLRRHSREGAQLWLDIGDSKYSGVLVRTPEILTNIAEDLGWVSQGAETIRQRRSYDGSVLSQVLLKFELGI